MTNTGSSSLAEIKRRLGLPITQTNTSNEFLDAAPFVLPFTRGERIYKIADWTGMGTSTSTTSSGIKPTSPTLANAETGPVGEEDWTSTLAGDLMGSTVGRRTVQGLIPPKTIASSAAASSQTASSASTKTRPQKGNHAAGAKQLGWGQRSHNDHRQKQRETSIRIDPSWKCREEIEFARLGKLAFDPEDPQLVASGGTLPLYNKTLDRLTTKSPKTLIVDESTSLPSYTPLSDDPVIQKLASSGEAKVFVSDVAASLLMAAPRTLSPWDLAVTWKTIDGSGNRVMFIDQRPGAQLHWTSVLESSTHDLMEDAQQLAQEATKINYLLPSTISISDGQDSIKLGDEATSAPFRYFKWNMGEESSLVIRSSLNCANRVAGAEVVGLVCGLFDASVCVDASSSRSALLDWRGKLDNQRGAVLAGEIKNNNAVIARWVFQAYLAQADLIKLAYVARASPKDRVKHELLGLQDLEPYELAMQMSLDPANGFGILKALVDVLSQTDESTSGVAIVRDPIKVSNSILIFFIYFLAYSSSLRLELNTTKYKPVINIPVAI